MYTESPEHEFSKITCKISNIYSTLIFLREGETHSAHQRLKSVSTPSEE